MICCSFAKSWSLLNSFSCHHIAKISLMPWARACFFTFCCCFLDLVLTERFCALLSFSLEKMHCNSYVYMLQLHLLWAWGTSVWFYCKAELRKLRHAFTHLDLVAVSCTAGWSYLARQLCKVVVLIKFWDYAWWKVKTFYLLWEKKKF